MTRTITTHTARWLFAALLCVPILLGGQAPPVMSGRVLDAETGQSIAGARVIVSPMRQLAMTDESGRFQFPLEGTTSNLAVYKPGYAKENLRPIAGAVEIRLQRGAAITVFVVDASNIPVPGRTLQLQCGNTRESFTTDEGGQIRMAYLQTGRCQLSIPPPDVVPPRMAPGASPAEQQAMREEMVRRLRARDELIKLGPPPNEIDLAPGDELNFVLLDWQPIAQSPTVVMPFDGPRGTGAIRGRLFDPAGRPIQGAQVALLGGGRQAITVTSGAGEYVFTGLPAGRYSVQGGVPPYGRRAYGERDGGSGTDLDLADAQHLDGIDIRFEPRQLISGNVFDERGEPAHAVQVAVIPVGVDPFAVPSVGPNVTLTDDRGAYRLFAPPGRYRIRALQANDTPYFHPGVTEPEHALIVDVSSRQGPMGVDVFMSPGGRVPLHGTVVASGGAPASGAAVSMLGFDEAGTPRVGMRTATDAQGRFTFAAVPPGEYLVSAVVQPQPYVIVRSRNGQPVDRTPTPALQHGSHELSIGVGVPTDIAIRAAPLSSIAGRVVVEGGDRSVALSSFRLYAAPAPVPLPQGGTPSPVGDDGTFELTVGSGPARILLAGSADWWLQSLIVDGVNVAEDAYTFPDGPRRWEHATATIARTARFEGHVTDAQGAAVGRYVVVAFPVEPARRQLGSRFVRMARPDQRGMFQMSLPPGTYWVAALDRLDDAGPAWYRSLESVATRVTLTGPVTVQRQLEIVRRP